MPYLARPGAQIFYDLTGEGVPVITTHGFIENGSYWGRTGISSRLAEAGYRVADMDMRGHGRSVPEGDDPRYTVEAVAEDVGALADALGFSHFVLLTHATGGMAGLRYAMNNSDRLLALVATDTSSATLPLDDYCGVEWDDAPFPEGRRIPGAASVMADILLGYGSVSSMMAALRADPEQHMLAPYFNRFDANADPERAWRWAEEIYAVNNMALCADFARSFFNDPDPQTAGLKRIACPTLVVVGEDDVQLRKPCALIARCVPGAREVVLKGQGHMTAIEDPAGLADLLIGFLKSLRP